ANVANLQLARAAVRSRELAVRAALGASRGALMRQLLTESLLIATAGGVLALLVAVWGVPVLLSLNPGALPMESGVRLAARVLGFTAALALGTGLLFGLAPSIRVAWGSLQGTLRAGDRGSTGDRAGLAMRRTLVVATVGIAITLLAGAGLLIRSFAR